ncbi:Uncharacterised protein [[Clostridium] sordellii]|uniref:Uncharacterized protein n=1 Tax=Paraclostridium sordellii TaxID=1505 RepID=A0A9P1PAQ5_PARSO|nr:Uncharacterised protein [[Clostridium] sordellii] [Paeniclostridium sordellii]
MENNKLNSIENKELLELLLTEQEEYYNYLKCVNLRN